MREMYSLLGFLGTNVDFNVEFPWIKTELVNHAEQGDKFSLYRLMQLARHSKQKAEQKYAQEMVKLLTK